MPSKLKMFLARMDADTESLLAEAREAVAASLGLEVSRVTQSMLLRLGLIELLKKHAKPARKPKGAK